MKFKLPWVKKDAPPEFTDPIARAASERAQADGKKTKTQYQKKSHWAWRMLKISPFGVLKLAIYSTLVGFFMMAVDVQQQPEEVAAATALTYGKHVAKLAWQALQWAADNFWSPAMMGASIVLPLWLLWRFISLPFRK